MRSPVSMLVLVLVGCVACTSVAVTKLPPEKPITDASQIVGTWYGHESGRASRNWTITIEADGTYKAVASDGSRGAGVYTIADGKVRWKTQRGQTGVSTLYEGDGKRIIRAVADDGSFVVEQVPAQ